MINILKKKKQNMNKYNNFISKLHLDIVNGVNKINNEFLNKRDLTNKYVPNIAIRISNH